jgi:hypothetical protein
MEIELGDFIVEVDVDEEGQIPSPHTGRGTLRRTFDVSFRDDDDTEAIRAVLSDVKNGSVITEKVDGDTERKWAVTKHSWSSSRRGTNGPTHYTHHFEVMEEEAPLKPTALLLGDLRLEPYHFEEKAEREGTIQIRARVKLP